MERADDILSRENEYEDEENEEDDE